MAVHGWSLELALPMHIVHPVIQELGVPAILIVLFGRLQRVAPNKPVTRVLSKELALRMHFVRHAIQVLGVSMTLPIVLHGQNAETFMLKEAVLRMGTALMMNIVVMI